MKRSAPADRGAQSARPVKRNQHSAGILVYRWRDGELEVFLVHPGGPYWARKDEGVWSIPKGECLPGEDALQSAQREFHEETGFRLRGPFMAPAPIKQTSGKTISAWAAQAELDAAQLRSNCFTLEWPPHSGVQQQFPEVDRGGWFTLRQASAKLLPGQRALLQDLLERIGLAA